MKKLPTAPPVTADGLNAPSIIAPNTPGIALKLMITTQVPAEYTSLP